MIAAVLFVASRCHRLPPLPSDLPWEKWKAKDGEGAPRWQSLAVSSQVFARSPSRRDGRRDGSRPTSRTDPKFLVFTEKAERGSSTTNRGHDAHHRALKCCSACEGRPRRFGGAQCESGT